MVLVLLLAVLPSRVPSPARLGLATTASGGYTISVDGAEWFTGAATSYTSNHKELSTADGSLKLASATTGSGGDADGAFDSTTWSWDDGKYVTEFRVYPTQIVFEQRFPLGAKGTTKNASHPMGAREHVSSSFPQWVNKAPPAARAWLQFSGDMTGSNFKHGMGSLPHDSRLTGVKGFGPIAVWSADHKSTVVFSSHSQFMAASSAGDADGTSIKYGVQGSITEYPVGYSVSFVLALAPAGATVNAAFEAWGDTLLARTGKDRAVTYRDYALNYLAYSTDNGAYYYYQTEGHAAKRGPPYTPGKTYQQVRACSFLSFFPRLPSSVSCYHYTTGSTSSLCPYLPPPPPHQTLIDVKKYAESVGIPYKYILLDSWWYYQGVGGGVTNWIGRPDVFPNGNSFLRNATGWPIMGHNRYWAIDNVYWTGNGGDYDFVVEDKSKDPKFHNFAWPTEQRFWDDLMYNSSQWGLFQYEQDWLDTEYDNVIYLNTNATAARIWLEQMASAAQRNGLTIQYCMSHCRHIMQSIELPAVTNARASGDYHPGNDQWSPLGVTGIFAWAVGIAPTKDNFWTTDVQSGSAYSDHATMKEPYNRMQSAVSTLSKGPVAPSDKIGASNVELIMKSIAADGKLLQGDKPAMMIQANHDARAKLPGADAVLGDAAQIWSTTTTLDGSDHVWATTIAINLPGDYKLDLQKEIFESSVSFAQQQRSYASYEANETDTMIMGDLLDLKACKMWDFQLVSSAPVLPNGWALLGEPSKWVAVSAARFRNLAYFALPSSTSNADATVASVTATGPEGEAIEVAWLSPAGVRTVVSCEMPVGNTISVTISSAGKGACVQV